MEQQLAAEVEEREREGSEFIGVIARLEDQLTRMENVVEHANRVGASIAAHSLMAMAEIETELASRVRQQREMDTRVQELEDEVALASQALRDDAEVTALHTI